MPEINSRVLGKVHLVGYWGDDSTECGRVSTLGERTLELKEVTCLRCRRSIRKNAKAKTRKR